MKEFVMNRFAEYHCFDYYYLWLAPKKERKSGTRHQVAYTIKYPSLIFQQINIKDFADQLWDEANHNRNVKVLNVSRVLNLFQSYNSNYYKIQFWLQ